MTSDLTTVPIRIYPWIICFWINHQVKESASESTSIFMIWITIIHTRGITLKWWNLCNPIPRSHPLTLFDNSLSICKAHTTGTHFSAVQTVPTRAHKSTIKSRFVQSSVDSVVNSAHPLGKVTSWWYSWRIIPVFHHKFKRYLLFKCGIRFEHSDALHNCQAAAQYYAPCMQH